MAFITSCPMNMHACFLPECCITSTTQGERDGQREHTNPVNGQQSDKRNAKVSLPQFLLFPEWISVCMRSEKLREIEMICCHFTRKVKNKCLPLHISFWGMQSHNRKLQQSPRQKFELGFACCFLSSMADAVIYCSRLGSRKTGFLSDGSSGLFPFPFQ